jgi:hypothetical protein
MGIEVVENRRINTFMGDGLDLMIHGLLNQREVWIVDSESLLGDQLLVQIRDALLERVHRGIVTLNEYKDSLSRIYQFQQPPDALALSDLPPIIIELSISWNIKY